jgi:hypothetical protein
MIRAGLLNPRGHRTKSQRTPWGFPLKLMYLGSILIYNFVPIMFYLCDISMMQINTVLVGQNNEDYRPTTEKHSIESGDVSAIGKHASDPVKNHCKSELGTRR